MQEHVIYIIYMNPQGFSNVSYILASLKNGLNHHTGNKKLMRIKVQHLPPELFLTCKFARARKTDTKITSFVCNI